VSDRIRVVIVDDHQLVREGLAALLETAPQLEVVGLAEDGQRGLELIDALTPEVLLLDLSMPVLDGLDVLKALRNRIDAPRVVILTTFDDDLALMQATALGAVGFLLKDLSREELVSAIIAVHRGERALRPTVGQTLRSALRSAPRARRPDADRGRPIEPMTTRELDVLRLMAGGLSNKEIAAALSLAEGTVKNHVSTILDKFGVTDRTRAVLKAIERGVV